MPKLTYVKIKSEARDPYDLVIYRLERKVGDKSLLMHHDPSVPQEGFWVDTSDTIIDQQTISFGAIIQKKISRGAKLK